MNRRWIFLPAVVTGWVLLVSSPQTSAGLVATYQFQDTLAADEAGAPALTALNSGAFVTSTNVLGQTRTVYERTSTNPSHDTQSALTVSVAALGLTSNDYSVELVYDFTNGYSGPDFRRVVNANGGDPGLYVSSRTGPGNLQIDDWLGYSHTGAPPLADGTFYHLILSVTPTGEQVYINGVLALNLVGLTPNAITAANLTFFQDNAGEYGNGSVALLRIYDSALNASQVSAAWNNGDPFAAAAVPEPASLSLAAVGGLVVLVLARGRRGLG